MVVQPVAPIIQELSIYSIRVNYTATDITNDLVGTLHPNQLMETVQILRAEKVLHMRQGCRPGYPALGDFGREKATFLVFQDEMSLMSQILRRELIRNHLLKRCNFENISHSKYEMEYVHRGLRLYMETMRDNSDLAATGATQMNPLPRSNPGCRTTA
jgi:hypothetical protein